MESKQDGSAAKGNRTFLLTFVSTLSLLFFFKEWNAMRPYKSKILQIHEVPQIVPRTSPRILPTLLPTDKIYKSKKWGNPFIIYEYKLVFFTIPKVSCTNWKLLFRRMEGQPDWNTTLHGKLYNLHDPSTNNLTVLYDIPYDEAQHALTSPEWTRAVFMREPKERVLSAFLNKFVADPYFKYKCCKRTRKKCKKERKNRNFMYFLRRTRDCHDEHWDPQFKYIDAKWWNMINFVGYMDTVADDSRRLLKSLTSSKDGVSAWERYGKTGWGRNRTNSFMEREVKMKVDDHATNAGDKLRQYYTIDTEKFVERYWRREWNHSVYHFEKFYLYGNRSTHENRK